MTSDTPRKKIKYKNGYTKKSVRESRTPPRDTLLVELESRDNLVIEKLIDKQNALEKVHVEQGNSVNLRPLSFNKPYGESGDYVLFRHTPRI